MNKVRVFLLLLAGFFFAAVLPAQTTICLDFDELQAGTVYSPANGYEPGDLVFNEQNVAVSVDEFFLSNGNTAFGMTSVLNVPLNFPPPIAGGLGLFPNNMNLVFDFSGVQGAMLGVGFAYQDAGGTENLSVNGGDMFILSSLTQLPTAVAPGVTAQVVPYPGLIPPVGGVFLTGPVETLTVGGQQLALDNFCYQIEEANADCVISELSATPLDCNPDNGYSVLVDFLHENGSGAGFEVVVNGQGYGTFSYDDLPVTIGAFPGDGTSSYEIHVIDLANPDCSAVAEFGPVECNSAPCHIFEVGADATDCVDGQFYAILYFQYENVGSEGFNVHGNGVNYGNFEYGNVPITIGPLDGDGTTVYEFVVSDNQHPDCQNFTVIGPVDCGTGGPCDIFDLVVDTGDCNPDNGYNITINFQVDNPGNDFFEVFYDGQNIGFFPISELPVTIENFQDNGEPVVHINVCINDHPDCCQVAEFVSPCPAGGDCHIFDLGADATDCVDGQFYVTLYFQYENVGSEGFKVLGNGVNYGNFEYANVPITIGPLVGDGTTVYEFVVQDNQHPDCHDFTVIGQIDCGGGGDCQIFEVGADATDCVDGQFYAILYLQYENVGGEGFNVHGNGVNYGNFEYANVPITIGPLEGDGTTIYEFVVQDNQHPDCHDFTVIGPIDCGGGGDCDIFELVVEPGECNGEGQYPLFINFQYENAGNDFFEVFYDGQNLGLFPLAELPITLEDFEDNGEAVVHINICINDQPDCCQIAEFESPCPGGGDCHIFDLVADVTDCEDGQFYVFLNFQYENVGGEGFNVHGNGVNYGNFEYGNLPITIGPLDGNGSTEYEFGVSDLLHPDCGDAISIPAVDCPDGGNVWPGDANSDNIANNLDLLNLGIAFGAIGPTRNNPSILWDGWPSQDWVETFPSGVNFKHADCDGTGSVDGGDIEAIELNYNETHGTPEPVDYSTGTEDDPPLFADLPDQELQAGDPIEIPILLGTVDQQVNNIYGIAFTLVFNPDLIDPSSVNLEWPNSWLGAPGVNAITVDKKFVEEGVIEVAITRIDSNPVSGFGEILAFIGIIDDVLGKHEMTIEIEKVRAIQFNEGLVSLRYPQESVLISSLSEPGIQTEGITVFPNPASDNLNWTLAGNKHTSYAAVIDVNGRTIQEQFETGAQLSIRSLPSGMYWLKVRSGDEVYMARFVKAGL